MTREDKLGNVYNGEGLKFPSVKSLNLPEKFRKNLPKPRPFLSERSGKLRPESMLFEVSPRF